MEDRPRIDPGKLAFKQYMSSTQKARYTSLAQKLSQHINHLAEDKNTRIRWIWELIQNAKDVPNEFNRCRMIFQIKEDKLTFAHNGDPFRVSDLQSLVAQYSSKEEQNDPNKETTGKYGTGFIVTYILSKKIRIKGLLEMKIQEQNQEKKEIKKEQSQDEGDLQLCQEDEIINRKPIKKIQKSQPSEMLQQSFLSKDLDNEEDKSSQLKSTTSKAKRYENGDYYQKFSILLDREYKDRDRQLYYKLMETQRVLKEGLQNIEPQPKYQRKQKQLDTKFIYQGIDQAAHKMINESMACLKELFPYVLLFNPKLYQVQVVDKRKGKKKIKNFSIKKQSEQYRNGLKIFNVKITEEGLQQHQTFSLAYIQDEYTYSTIAIPLEIKKNSIKLLEMNSKFPKMFKEFPLIGCKDTGFNFAFTSKRFYPNENRSNLLLEQIQGRDSKKTKANWESLVSIFEKGLQLYKTVSRVIDSGRQNLFIVSLQNHFSQQVFYNKNMRGIYLRYKLEISQFPCIEFKNNAFGRIKELIYPMGKSQNKSISDKDYSSSLNSVFDFVLGQENILSDQNYGKFYDLMQNYTYSNTWKEFIKFVDVKDCIQKLCQLKFQGMVQKTKSKQAALKILENVYHFLSKNNPSYFTKDQSKPDKKYQLKFILNNRQLFKDINQKLFIKENLPQAYEEIGKQLGIDVNAITVHNNFIEFFPNMKPFGASQMFRRFENYFFSYNAKGSCQILMLLGRFITTFDIKTEALDLCKKIKDLVNIQKPFKLKQPKSILPLDNKVKMQFRLLFEIKIMLYVNQLMQENQSLAKFMQLTQFAYNESQKAIQWFNNVFQFEETLLTKSNTPEFMRGYTAATSLTKRPQNLIQRNLSLQLKWVPLQKLKYFCSNRDLISYKGNYPDKKDLQMHQKMREVYNRRCKNVQFDPAPKTELESQILHEAIKYKLPSSTTFQNQFGFITEVYHNSLHIRLHEKVQILNYISHLRQSAVKQRQFQFKILTFQELEKIAYYQYPAQTKCIKTYEDQIYAFSFIKNPKEIKAARQIVEEYGSLYKALAELQSLKTQGSITKEK